MKIDDFSNPILLIDGKEVGVLAKRPAILPSSPKRERPDKPQSFSFSFSFSAELTEENQRWLRWEAERPKRIKKYIEQLTKRRI